MIFLKNYKQERSALIEQQRLDLLNQKTTAEEKIAQDLKSLGLDIIWCKIEKTGKNYRIELNIWLPNKNGNVGFRINLVSVECFAYPIKSKYCKCKLDDVFEYGESVKPIIENYFKETNDK